MAPCALQLEERAEAKVVSLGDLVSYDLVRGARGQITPITSTPVTSRSYAASGVSGSVQTMNSSSLSGCRGRATGESSASTRRVMMCGWTPWRKCGS